MGPSSSRRILLADDNPVNRHSMSLLLGKLGHEVTTANDGGEVLEILRQQSYDVVILDLHMPRVDGPEAARRIRQEWSADERPRLILLTASASRAARDLCLAAGADEFLLKPAEISRLDLAIRGEPSIELTDERAGDNGEAIDASVLDDVASEMGNDDSLIAELIDVFLSDARNRVGALRRALTEADPVAFGSTAHALKGGAGAVGAKMLARRCRECECLSPRDLTERGETLLAALEAEHDRAREALLALART